MTNKLNPKIQQKIHINLSKSFLDWLRIHYPGAAPSWIINMLCNEFMAANKGNKSPRALARKTGEHITEKLSG